MKCVVCERPLKRKGSFCGRALCLNVKSYYHKNLKAGYTKGTAMRLALATKSARTAVSGQENYRKEKAGA
jgi:hypothetical protein